MDTETHTFGGWYDNGALAGTAVTEISATDSGDKEYWAKWIPIDYNIIEIRVDVKDMLETVPGQDKEVIESGLTEYRKEKPGLPLGEYVDISMFVRVGEGEWDAVTSTEEPIEVAVVLVILILGIWIVVQGKKKGNKAVK